MGTIKPSMEIIQERIKYLKDCLEKIEDFRWKDKLFEMNSYVSSQVFREIEYQRTHENMEDSLLSRLKTLQNVKLKGCNDSARRRKLSDDEYYTSLKHLREDYEYVLRLTKQKKTN
jgi:hypothetical protein